MLYSGTDPESYITEYTLVYEENVLLGMTALARSLPSGPTEENVRLNKARFVAEKVFLLFVPRTVHIEQEITGTDLDKGLTT